MEKTWKILIYKRGRCDCQDRERKNPERWNHCPECNVGGLEEHEHKDDKGNVHFYFSCNNCGCEFTPEEM